MNEVFVQYGVLGVMVGTSLSAIYYLVKWLKKKDEEHAKERSEWLQTMEDITDKSDKTSKETNTIIRENSSILFGLKSLLEQQKRNP